MASVIEVRDERVPLRDGACLAADVLVDVARGPQPVLLVRTPYSRAAMRAAHDFLAWSRAGWAVLVQDVRGRFDSSGRFEPFRQEVADGYDTIEWCVRQPWRDGRVAMTGWSYVGATQWLAGLSGHPALKAINPLLGAGDIADVATHEGGAFQLGFVQPWALALAGSDPHADPEARRGAIELCRSWDAVLRSVPAADPVGAVLPAYREWRGSRGWPPGGAAAPTDVSSGTITGQYGKTNVAAFQVAGWYDLFCESALRHYTHMTTEAPTEWARRSQRLVIGPWSHGNQLSNLHPELDFGGDANGVYNGTVSDGIEWMRRSIDGAEVQGGVTCFVMGEGRWRELASWPPPARPVSLYLASGERGANSRRGDGVLGPTPPPEGGCDVFDYDPADPVPSRGGRVHGPFLPMAGAVDQSVVEERLDVLVYTSQVFVGTLTLIGRIEACVYASSSGRSMDVTVKVCDVHPDGRSVNVVDSVRRVLTVPGRVQAVEVEVGSIAHQFNAGHRVRVEVSSSNFPRFDRNPSTGEDPATAGRLERATQRVWWGPAHPSAVTLPFVDA